MPDEGEPEPDLIGLPDAMGLPVSDGRNNNPWGFNNLQNPLNAQRQRKLEWISHVNDLEMTHPDDWDDFDVYVMNSEFLHNMRHNGTLRLIKMRRLEPDTPFTYQEMQGMQAAFAQYAQYTVGHGNWVASLVQAHHLNPMLDMLLALDYEVMIDVVRIPGRGRPCGRECEPLVAHDGFLVSEQIWNGLD